MKIIDIWINCPTAEVAEQIAESLLEDRLIACSNTFPAISSAFHWKGGIDREGEVPLLVKTRQELFAAVAARVRELHPYETPSTTGLLVDLVDEDYRRWVYEETRAPDGDR